MQKDRSKPFILCEYTHAMGNSCGGMHKYTDLSDREPLYQGGFIWDYIDQSIYHKDRYGKEVLGYAAILMTDHVIIILAEMVLFTAVHASLLRKCKK